MAKTRDSGLRGEIERSGRPYPAALRRRVVEHAQRAREAGRGVDRIALDLGIAPQTLRSWLPSTAFAAVEVGHEMGTAIGPVVVVDARSGVRVEGLDLVAAAELVKRLR